MSMFLLATKTKHTNLRFFIFFFFFKTCQLENPKEKKKKNPFKFFSPRQNFDPLGMEIFGSQ